MLSTRTKRLKNACLAMTLYGVIGLKRVKCCIYMQHFTNTTPILHLHTSKCQLQNQAVSSLPMHKPTVPDLPINNLPGYIQNLHVTGTSSYITTNPMLHSHATSHYWYINIHSHGLHAVTHLLGPHAVPNHHSPWLCLGPCTGPSSFTYMGHLDELQPTITNPMHHCSQ